MATTEKTGRRRFLRRGVLSLPIVAAGGALPGIGLAATRGGKAESGDFPGDPAAWRTRFLEQAQRERAPSAALGRVAGQTQALPLPVVTLAPDARPAPAAPAAAATAPAGTGVVMRMQDELQRALKKPIDQRKWVMVIDLRKCIGCSACTVACKAENHLPPGVVYRPVIEEEAGTYPNVTRRFLPRPCMQCDEPPCVKVCPVSATWKRADGIVVIDYNACIGCRYCIAACPYGARTFDFGESYSDGTPEEQPYEQSPSPEYGREWKRSRSGSPAGNVRKCQFCIHRLNAGMLPACVTTCVGAATYFGDQNDPDSLVNELIAGGRAMRLKEELGTKPKVYYLM